jgi:hypothetical protein
MINNNDNSTSYLPPFEMINYFDSTVPMITPSDYHNALDSISKEMSKYGIEDYLNNADYNGFSYYAWKSYIFSDDASGRIKFNDPHFRSVMQPETLRTIWSILLLANTKTQIKTTKGNIVQITYQDDLPQAIKQSKSKPLSHFYE